MRVTDLLIDTPDCPTVEQAHVECLTDVDNDCLCNTRVRPLNFGCPIAINRSFGYPSRHPETKLVE